MLNMSLTFLAKRQIKKCKTTLREGAGGRSEGPSSLVGGEDQAGRSWQVLTIF